MLPMAGLDRVSTVAWSACVTVLHASLLIWMQAVVFADAHAVVFAVVRLLCKLLQDQCTWVRQSGINHSQACSHAQQDFTKARSC